MRLQCPESPWSRRGPGRRSNSSGRLGSVLLGSLARAHVGLIWHPPESTVITTTSARSTEWAASSDWPSEAQFRTGSVGRAAARARPPGPIAWPRSTRPPWAVPSQLRRPQARTGGRRQPECSLRVRLVAGTCQVEPRPLSLRLTQCPRPRPGGGNPTMPASVTRQAAAKASR